MSSTKIIFLTLAITGFLAQEALTDSAFQNHCAASQGNASYVATLK